MAYGSSQQTVKLPSMTVNFTLNKSRQASRQTPGRVETSRASGTENVSSSRGNNSPSWNSSTLICTSYEKFKVRISIGFGGPLSVRFEAMARLLN